MDTIRSTRKPNMKLPYTKRSHQKLRYTEVRRLPDCQRNMSNEDGNKSTLTTDYSHYDCSDADWDKYITQGWNSVLWNRPDHGAWKEVLDKAGYGREAAMPDPQKGDLANDIHHIFARTHWIQGVSDEIWDIISPALRLASKMLVSKAALAFFRQVRFGSKRRGGGRTYLHYEAPEDVKEQEDEVKNCLDRLASRLRLLFAATPTDPVDVDPDMQCHAVHCVSHHYFGKQYFIRGNLDALPEDNGKKHFLLVNQAYAELLTSYDRSQRRNEPFSPSDFIRATFALASSLVHEVGHAFYARDRTDGDEAYVEPYFDLEQHNDKVELGYALEFAMFNVHVNIATSPQHGTQLEWQPVVKELVGDYIVVFENNHLTFPMDPTWMHSLMTQAFWDRLESEPAEEQSKGLFVPTEVEFGATLDPKMNEWKWRVDKAQLTRHGHTPNRRELAKLVTLRKRKDKRMKAQQPKLSVAGRRYGLRSTKQRVQSLLSIAAGPIAVF